LADCALGGDRRRRADGALIGAVFVVFRARGPQTGSKLEQVSALHRRVDKELNRKQRH
jgi:hypothetical protein